MAGGTQIESRKPFIYGYVWCDKVLGAIAHSCIHGPPPHNIKVCLMKGDNSRDVWDRFRTPVIAVVPWERYSPGLKQASPLF